ncbi:MAG: YneF family protein [Solobacterium sp.]|nr:YneF family protein [Solobacterium sp.]
MSAFWGSLGWFVFGGVVGAAIAYFLTRRAFEKQLKENPPVNEKMIRAMFMQMGRKPSEAQIKQVMKAMQQ